MHSRLADTKSDDFRVGAIAALRRRCRWERVPGTVSWVVSACVTGTTDSIHLSPESVDDDTNSLIAGSRVVGVADIEFDRYGDLTLVTREIPAIEGDVCGFHGCCLVIRRSVGFAVGFAARFIVGKFWHV